MKFFVFLTLSCLSLAAQVTKPVQVYSVSGQLQWPPSFFMTNVFASGGTTLSFDSLGRMTISSASGSGTNTLFQTNGVSLGSAGTVNWTTGVTGYLAGAVANLGVSVSPSGGGASVADLLVVSNQLQTASNKFQTDVSNLQGATNGLAAQILVVSNQGAFASNYFQGVTTAITNQFRTDITSMSNLIILSSNKFQTDVSNLQGATNGLHTRVGNLEGATNGLDALVRTKQHGSTHLTNLANNPYVQYTNINAFQASNNILTTWLGTGVLTNIVNNSTSFPAGQFGWVGSSNNGDVRIRTISQGANITITDQGTNLSIAAAGGSGSPGGNSGAIQFNETATFAGTNDFIFDRTNKIAKIQVSGSGTGLGKYAAEWPSLATNYVGATGMIGTNVGSQNLILGVHIGSVFNGIQIGTNNVSPGGNTLSNHSDIGRFDLTWRTNYAETFVANQAVRLGGTNGGSGTIFSNNGVFRPTNVFVFTVTNPTIGQVLKFNSVTYGGATATILVTNDVDNSGGGGGGLSGIDNIVSNLVVRSSATNNTNLVIEQRIGQLVPLLSVKDSNNAPLVTIDNRGFMLVSNGVTSYPTYAPTNTLAFGVDSYGGREFPETWDDHGIGTVSQPAFFNNRISMLFPNSGSALGTLGMPSTVIGGTTVTHPTPDQTFFYMVQMASPATSNANATIHSTIDMATKGPFPANYAQKTKNGFFATAEFCVTNGTFGVIAGGSPRVFVGLSALATPNVTNLVITTNATGQYLGFYMSPRDDTNIWVSSRDHVAEFRVNTGIICVPTNLYQIYLFNSPSNAYVGWRIKDLDAKVSASGLFSNNVPTNSMKFVMSIKNSTSIVHSIRFSKIYLEAPLSH